MGQRKVLAGSLGLALVGLVAVSCGKSSKTPGAVSGGGQGGEANVVDPGEGGAFTAGQGGAVTEAGRGGGGVAGDASAGTGGVAGEPNGGATLGEAGAAGSGGAASDGCDYRGKPHAVGERFAGLAYWQVCECKSGGEVSCVEGCDAWINTEAYRLIDEARECDYFKQGQCQVLKSVSLPFAGDYVSFFNEASLGALDGLQEVERLHAELDCDAPIVPPQPQVPPTTSYCSPSGHCVDRWTGLNLLKNGGFEDLAGDVPTAWVLTPSLAFALQAPARTGTRALAATLSDTAVTYRLVANVTLPVPASRHTLSVSGYYLVDRVDSELAVTLTLDGLSPNDPTYSLPAPTTAGAWQPFSLPDLYVPYGDQYSVGFGVRLVKGAATTIAFDDLMVEETTGR